MPKYQKDVSFLIKMSDEERVEFLKNTMENLDIEDKIMTAILYLTGARPQEIKLMTKRDIVINTEEVTFHIKTVKHGFDRAITLTRDTPFIEMVIKYLETKNDDDLIYTKTLRTYRYNLEKASFGKLCPYAFRHFRTDYIVKITGNIEMARYWRGTKKVQSIEPYIHSTGVLVRKLKDKIR